MVSARNKAKRLSSINHTTKTIYHHHHQHHHHHHHHELLFETERSEVRLILWFVSIKFIGSFLKFCFLISLYKRLPLYFQLLWKNIYIYRNVPFPSADIIMIALFYFSSVFPQKVITFFFSFAYFVNKIVKSKSKTTFSKLLKVYIYYIFLM